jgi:uncharacterized protein (DUF983 family)
MELFKKKSWMWSVHNMKCPKCREGDLFHTSTFSFQKSFDMAKRCDKCNQSYMPEPGFYFGSMYVSYALSSGFCLVFSAVFIMGFKMPVLYSFTIMIFILAIFFVWIFRISRSLWIHSRVKYNPK